MTDVTTDSEEKLRQTQSLKGFSHVEAFMVSHVSMPGSACRDRRKHAQQDKGSGTHALHNLYPKACAIIPVLVGIVRQLYPKGQKTRDSVMLYFM